MLLPNRPTDRPKWLPPTRQFAVGIAMFGLAVLVLKGVYALALSH